MATTAMRLLLNKGKASFGLSRGSSMVRSALGRARDQHKPLESAQFLSRTRLPEPPLVDLEAVLGTQGSISLVQAGRSWPVFDMGTARSYSRGRRGSEMSDDDNKDVSDEEFDDGEYDDDMEGFDSDDVYDIDEEMDDDDDDDDDEEDEKPRKKK